MSPTRGAITSPVSVRPFRIRTSGNDVTARFYIIAATKVS